MEEDEGRKEEIITSSEDNICVTRDMLKNIVSNTLEEQKKQSEAGSKETIKSLYSEGMKKGFEIQRKPLLSSTIWRKHVMGNYLVNHSTIGTREPMRNAPNSVHSLSSKGINYITKQPLVASNAQPIQTVLKLPVPITCGETHGNQTQQSGSGIWSEKRNQSQILYIYIYMNIEDKAALKVEEVVESADGTWDVTKMWDALD